MHAWWMSKAIYALKIWIFQDQFALSPTEIEGLNQVSLFITKIYIFHWYTTPSPISAPTNDLALIIKIVQYRKVNKIISDAVQAVLDVISRHL